MAVDKAENPENDAVQKAITEARERLPRVLRGLKAVRKMSDHELAQRMGMSRSAVQARLQGQTTIGSDELVGFAEAFNVPVSLLFLPPDEAVARSRCLTEMAPDLQILDPVPGQLTLPKLEPPDLTVISARPA